MAIHRVFQKNIFSLSFFLPYPMAPTASHSLGTSLPEGGLREGKPLPYKGLVRVITVGVDSVSARLRYLTLPQVVALSFFEYNYFIKKTEKA